MNRIVRILSVSSALLLCAQGAIAQCENKSGFAKLACQAQTNSNGPFQAAKPDPKTFLSTSFADTIHGETLPANIDPKAFKPLTELDRTDDGAFILKPGIYEAYVQSYTLEPGDVNATKAGGYYPAPIKGTKAKIVSSLLKQIELHPDVSQSDVQFLLFAIVQGVDLEKMPPNVQQTAVRVLPKDIVREMQAATQAKAFQQGLMNILNAHAAKDKNAQANQQKMADFNNQLKQMQQQAEATAAFNGQPDAAAPVVRGTWVQMPGGFYVRYLPDGYVKTRLQLMVPDEAVTQAQTPLTFDPTQYLAVLGQAPSERLGISLRPAR
jgi:hypothetical protein